MDLSGSLCSKSHVFRIKDEFIFLIKISRNGGSCSCEAVNVLCKSKCSESLLKIFHFLEFDQRYEFRHLIRGTLQKHGKNETPVFVFEEPFLVDRVEGNLDCNEDCFPPLISSLLRFECAIADLQHLSTCGVILLESNVVLVLCCSVLMELSLAASDNLTCFNTFPCNNASVAKLFHPRATSLLFVTEQSTLVVKRSQETVQQARFVAQECIFAYAVCKFNLSPVELVQLFRLRQVAANQDGKVSRSFNNLVKNFCRIRWSSRSKRNFTSAFLENAPFPNLSLSDERLVTDADLQEPKVNRFHRQELSTGSSWECSVFRAEEALLAGQLVVSPISGELRLRTEASAWLVRLDGPCRYVNAWVLLKDVSLVKERVANNEGSFTELCYLQLASDQILWSSAGEPSGSEMCLFFVVEKFGQERAVNTKTSFLCRALVTVANSENRYVSLFKNCEGFTS